MWIIGFASKVGFFISYVATFFLVLEVVRLVCSDANKREAERLLDAYTRGRGSEKKHEESCKLSVEELERGLETPSIVTEPIQPPQTPQHRTQRTMLRRTPTSEKTLINEEKRKRSQTPTRRLRKRSDTLNSTGTSDFRHSSRWKSSPTTSESRPSSRSHRDSSPESTTSKSSLSRNASPGRRRSKDASLSLHRLLRQKV